MKALVCDLCGSNDIMKQDGCFVCQHCGTKYSVEEARKMMIEGTVEVQGTVKIDNTDSIKNYLEIGKNALIAGNGKQAEIYANKALEIDPHNADAWALKMRSYESTATIGDVQTDDLCAAAINVIEYAPNRDKAEKETYGYILDRVFSLLLVAKSKLEDTEEIKRTQTRFAAISVMTADSNTQDVDKKTISLYDGIATAAVNLTSFVPDAALEKHPELPVKLLVCAHAYRAETESLQRRLGIYSGQLTNSAIETRNRMEMMMRKRAISAAKRDKAARIQAEIENLENEFKNGGEAQEYDRLREKVNNLLEQRSRMGIFEKRERQMITETMNDLTQKRDALAPSVKRMRADIKLQIQARKEILDILRI